MPLTLTSSSSEESTMATSIQVTLDCADPGKQAEFWAQALHYHLPDPPGGDDWAAIEDPDRAGPRLYFQRVPEIKVAKNRMHLDLNASREGDVPLEERKVRLLAEVERLKALGADDHRGAIEQDGEFWVRMNDPEGNEFCVQ
jgi:hypothetical protein